MIYNDEKDFDRALHAEAELELVCEEVGKLRSLCREASKVLLESHMGPDRGFEDLSDPDLCDTCGIIYRLHMASQGDI